uniref:BRCA1-associated protein n=1 Tax=Anthurium amnicola TaxID=1678845 RepID=A0A1D1ZKV5_9ARAE
MFRLRVHSVGAPRRLPMAAEIVVAASSGGDYLHHHPVVSSSPSSSSSPLAAAAANSNPSVQAGRGVVHIFRNASPHPASSYTTPSTSSPHQHHLPPLPVGRGTLLLVLAIPSRLAPEDFLHFCCWAYSERLSEVRVIRNDAVEERYSMLIQFDEQNAADSFYLELNGWRFPSEEAEVCHILFLSSVEYTESTEIAGSPPAGFTELPTCPVCLERLDQDISGIVTTGCDHSFQCSCISKWANSSCPVCRFCMEHCEKPNCSVCETSENLWVCMICGFVGCGRYREGHAIKHWKDTQHCYSLDLQTQRVWDYVGDTYVHRLNQSKSDGKVAKLKSRCSSIDDDCRSWECSEDSGISGALLNSKVDAIVDEYNDLLASQLETQHQYYESLILEAREKKGKMISEAVDKAVREKLHNIQLELEKRTEEKKHVADMNEKLLKDQKLLREKIKEVEDREAVFLWQFKTLQKSFLILELHAMAMEMSL